jgi:outer membrane protein TolC
MMRTLIPAARPVVLAAALAAALGGCASPSPFALPTEPDLRRSVVDAVEREMVDARRRPESQTLARTDLAARLGLDEATIAELERTGGPGSYDLTAVPLENDLLGAPARTIRVSLRRALQTAADRNVAIQFARLAPAVSESQVVAAEAAFDWTFFANGNWTNTDTPRVSTAFTGSTSPVRSEQTESITGNLGWRRTLVGGGRLTLQHDVGYTDANTPGQVNRPNPAEQASVTLQWDQPLLRNAGSEVTQAEIRVARNAERTAVQSLRRDMIRVLTDTEKAYWDLLRASYDVMVFRRLLERGEKVRDQLVERSRIDANQAQIARARADVERRRADVKRAQTQLQLVSNRLKALMNDPDLPEGSEVVVLPSDVCPDQAVRFSLLESLRQSVAYRPEIQSAAVAIDDASIRETVARSARLPDLSLRLQTRWSALDNTMGESYSRLFNGEFIDYLVGFSFEQPIGNRKAEAQFRQRRLERTQTVLAYRNAVQIAVGEVKAALLKVRLNYELIGQARASRLAAGEELRVLQVEKDISQGYTVERLDLELRQQEQLASQEQAEMQALVEYNQSIAELFQAIGTTLERNNIRLVVPGAGGAMQDWLDAP